MKYGYARVSADGQSVTAQVAELTKAGCAKVFRETASGAQTNRAQLRKALDQLGAWPAVRCFGPSGHRWTRLRAAERDRLDESALMWGILVFWRASQEQSEPN